MADAHPAVLRAAFDLGRAHNEFEWHIVNVLIGGAPGEPSLEALDRIHAHVEVMTATQMWIDFQKFLEAFRGDWEDTVYMERWHDNYAGLEEIYRAERDRGRSPTDIVLLFFTQFVDHYRTDLDRIVRAAFRHAQESSKVAYKLGRALDEGVRPQVVGERVEIATELGYVVGPSPPVTTLLHFVREVPNPEYGAWAERFRQWGRAHPPEKLFPEVPPPKTLAAPVAHAPGELPPPARWAGRVAGLWSRLGLERLPDLTSLPHSIPEQRLRMVQYSARLATEAFDRMGPPPSGRPADSDRPADSAPYEEEYREKLKLCTPAEATAFLQFGVAEQRLAGRSAGDRSKPPGDREAFDWLREHGGTPAGHPLPARFDTWARNLRGARKKLGEQKNKPRRGRTGGSIAHPDELDSPADQDD